MTGHLRPANLQNQYYNSSVSSFANQSF